MCQVSSSAWTAQNHRPQMPQWDVAVESQGSAMGETASQDHSRLRVSVWLDCCNISPPRAGSIHLAVVAEFQWKLNIKRISLYALSLHKYSNGSNKSSIVSQVLVFCGEVIA